MFSIKHDHNFISVTKIYFVTCIVKNSFEKCIFLVYTSYIATNNYITKPVICLQFHKNKSKI